MLSKIRSIFNINKVKAITLDQTYVINLARTPKRYDKIKQQLNYHNINHKRLDAVDGFDIKIIDVRNGYEFSGKDLLLGKYYLMFDQEYRIISGELEFIYKPDFESMHRVMAVGELGCYMSHVKAYKNIIDNNLNCALILEDDSDLISNFGVELSNILNNTPQKWDIIFLYLNFNQSKILKDTKNPYLKEINYSSRGMTCLGGYIVSHQGSLKLLKYTKKFSLPIDDLVSALISNNIIKSYIASHDLINSVYIGSFTDSIISQMGRTSA